MNLYISIEIYSAFYPIISTAGPSFHCSKSSSSNVKATCATRAAPGVPRIFKDRGNGDGGRKLLRFALKLSYSYIHTMLMLPYNHIDVHLIRIYACIYIYTYNLIGSDDNNNFLYCACACILISHIQFDYDYYYYFLRWNLQRRERMT